MATIIKARNAFEGNAQYQLRAREAFPILVRQAQAGNEMTYQELAHELGIRPRNANYVLGSVAKTLVDLGEEWKTSIPKLTGLVVNKVSRVPGDGFLMDVVSKEDLKKAKLADKRRITRAVLASVFAYPGWASILERFHLKPAMPFLPPPVHLGGGVEGEAHKRLKEYVAAHPQRLGLRTPLKTATEAELRSGDRLDVRFGYAKAVVGVEVKAADASPAEVARGMFQWVKYRAVLEAERSALQADHEVRVLLVLGGPLPPELVSLKHVLGVEVVENVRP